MTMNESGAPGGANTGNNDDLGKIKAYFVG